MKTIFLAGSLPIKVLSADVLEVLDGLIERNASIIIGDAPGVDTLIQEYFHSKNYTNVTVYAVGNKARNNIGGWDVELIAPDPQASKRDYYVIKDKVMTDKATAGIMVWDRVSRGTLNNMKRLLSQNKRVVVATSKGLHAIKSEEDLDRI